MSNVICKRNCKYRNSVYCGRGFTVLNSLGQCSIYFAENGQPRVFPLYPIEEKDSGENNPSSPRVPLEDNETEESNKGAENQDDA